MWIDTGKTAGVASSVHSANPRPTLSGTGLTLGTNGRAGSAEAASRCHAAVPATNSCVSQRASVEPLAQTSSPPSGTIAAKTITPVHPYAVCRTPATADATAPTTKTVLM